MLSAPAGVQVPAGSLLIADSAAPTASAPTPVGMVDVGQQLAALAEDNKKLQDRVTALENGGGGGGVQQDTESEATGEVVASGVFCTAWGAIMEIITGKAGSCDFPTVLENDIVLEGWMIPLLKHVRRVKG